MPIQKIRVAVLRGGDAPSFSTSLNSGKEILSVLELDTEAYEPVDIFISKDGVWHYRGLPIEPHVALKHADVAFSTLPGDIKIVQALENMRVPYVGSEAMSSGLISSIPHMRQAYSRAGLPTMRFELLHKENFNDNTLLNTFRTFILPATVRTHERNSGFASRLVASFKELAEAVAEAFEHTEKVVVEEFAKGKIAVCSVIENARNERLHALLPAEIKTDRISSPGTFTAEEKRAIEEMSRTAHKALGLRHFSSSKFLVTPKGKIYILETDAFPEITDNSSLRTSLKATGWKDKDFVEHLINLAR
jgi:D-alanine-D-alanine ligase